MTVGTNIAPSSPAELLGDPHPLLEQLGAPEDLAITSPIAHAVDFHQVSDLPSLRRFLDAYRTDILVSIELPAIVSAYQHAARGEAKELVALDERLAHDRTIRRFAIASCRVGQRQLSKLRPMRDQRLVQRYLAAIDEGKARGWHTLVYGVSLAMFSLPLRQGLQNYANQTLQGFIQSAARSLRLAEGDCETLFAAQSTQVLPAISSALDPTRLIALP
ncbi:MAG TPA: urease accessory UreF family protein [Methylomirabilota bacterium]|nr:urease accessory UreF family protein [Methylomirabilota bacterium]